MVDGAMVILHVIRRLQKSAGTSTFCVEVCNRLAACGHTVRMAMLKPEDRRNFALHPAIEVVSVDEAIGCDSRSLPDIVHLHALWTPFLHRVANWAGRNDIPMVWSTHGLTAPWAMRHKWFKKFPVWWLYQKWDLGKADAIHCTTDLEAEWNEALGYAKCFVAPLGTNESSGMDSSRPTMGQNRCLLFVGRLYPVKGLVNLIRAWGIVSERWKPGPPCDNHGADFWKLKIIGPDQAGHLSFLQSEARRLGLEGDVEFPGPKFGADLSVAYETCDALVLPSFTENFGATVIDALAHGKPVITSTFTPWREVAERGCGWWVSNEPTVLAKAIGEMIDAGESARREMGARGRALVEEKYTWDAVVDMMVMAYEKILANKKH